jgi:hypothetical protein
MECMNHGQSWGSGGGGSAERVQLLRAPTCGHGLHGGALRGRFNKIYKSFYSGDPDRHYSDDGEEYSHKTLSGFPLAFC